MTRTTNARIAGATFLLYIAAGIAGVILFGRATSGDGIAAKLASIAQHTTEVRVAVVLSLLTCFTALVLAVTLYGITRDQDPDLAMLALTCRVAEGLLGAIFLAVGSMLFSYLLLRGRMVPAALAWLGVIASGLLVVGLPGQLSGFFASPAFGLMWLPMLVFELTIALWL